MPRKTARYKEIARWIKTNEGSGGLLIEKETVEVSLREQGKVFVRIRTKFHPAHKPEGQYRPSTTSGWMHDSDTIKSVDAFSKDMERMGFKRVKKPT